MMQLDLFIPPNDTNVVLDFARYIRILHETGSGVYHALSYSNKGLGDQAALNHGYKDAWLQMAGSHLQEPLIPLMEEVKVIDPETIHVSLQGTEFEWYTDRILGIRTLMQNRTFSVISI